MTAEGTGVPVVDAAVIWSLAIAALVGLTTLVWRGVRAVRRMIDRVDDLVDDWQGVPGRPGVPERPGVMSRLHHIEQRLVGVEHELRPNSGRSLRDAVDRVDERTRVLADNNDT